MARNKFDADEEIEQKLNLRIIPRMLKWIKPYAWWMVLACVIMLVASGISLISPYLIRMAIDQAIPAANYNMLIFSSMELQKSCTTTTAIKIAMIPANINE